MLHAATTLLDEMRKFESSVNTQLGQSQRPNYLSRSIQTVLLKENVKTKTAHVPLRVPEQATRNDGAKDLLRGFASSSLRSCCSAVRLQRLLFVNVARKSDEARYDHGSSRHRKSIQVMLQKDRLAYTGPTALSSVSCIGHKSCPA